MQPLHRGLLNPHKDKIGQAGIKQMLHLQPGNRISKEVPSSFNLPGAIGNFIRIWRFFHQSSFFNNKKALQSRPYANT